MMVECLDEEEELAGVKPILTSYLHMGLSVDTALFLQLLVT